MTPLVGNRVQVASVHTGFPGAITSLMKKWLLSKRLPWMSVHKACWASQCLLESFLDMGDLFIDIKGPPTFRDKLFKYTSPCTKQSLFRRAPKKWQFWACSPGWPVPLPGSAYAGWATTSSPRKACMQTGFWGRPRHSYTPLLPLGRDRTTKHPSFSSLRLCSFNQHLCFPLSTLITPDIHILL